MSNRLIFPFGFLRSHLLREAARRDLDVVPESGPGGHRVIAVGVGGALGNCSVEVQLLDLLPAIDRVFLFAGLAFEQNARERSHAALLSMFQASGIAVDVIYQEAALGDLGSDATVFDSMEKISASLLERVLASPAA